MRVIMLAICCCLLSTISFCQLEIQQQEAIDALFAEWDEASPGYAIGVVKDGALVYSKGYGQATLEFNVPIDEQTIFHMASISKQFTAFGICLLAEQGKLSFDDDIRKYLPELADFGHEITIRHLIHHTSGMRDQWNLLALAGWRLDDVITREQVLRLIAKQKELNVAPGIAYNYCNTGYTLMGEIIARIGEMPFAGWMQKNVFDPLEMSNTFFYDDHERIVPNRAYSYYNANNGYKKSVLSYANAGATSLFTTVEDMAKWNANFYQPKVGKKETIQLMENRGILNNGDTISYAFGQSVGSYKGLKRISHGGADAGYRTYFLRFPEKEAAVIILSNMAEANTGGKAFDIAEIVWKEDFEQDKESKAKAIKKEPVQEPRMPSLSDLEAYAGSYFSEELEAFYHLEVKDQSLLARHLRHEPISIQIIKEDEGVGDRWFFNAVKFVKDQEGLVAEMLVSSGRVKNVRFKKLK